MPPRRSIRRTAEESDNSQKENAPQASPIARKIRTKGNRAPESEREESGREEPESPKGRKRARVNEEGDGHEIKVKPEPVSVRKQDRTLARDVDGFVTGSIVRVKLHNFVTYEDVEFRPGPHLNMIIGPNGTGKSSIACAIALGLNYHPSILGRANELNAFVKMGATEGFIEIELKGPVGGKNVVIRRKLTAKSKTSQFAMDGRQATGREVQQKMSELNIQVDSLCSFLPQDRVSEFAQMTPQQLLRETERSAGDDRLTAWHDALVNAGKERKELAELLAADNKQLETLQERNANLERDVQRFKERKEIERQIALLELIVPFMEYTEARERYTKAKEEQRRLHKEVQDLRKRHEPLHNLRKRFESQHRKLNELRDDKKKEAQQDVQTKLQNLKKAEKKRLKDIEDLEKNIAKIQRQLEEPVDLEDIQAIQEEIRQVNQLSQGMRSKQIDLQDRQRANVEVTSQARQEFNAAQTAMAQLEDEAHRKLDNYARFDPDGAAVVRWLRENRGRFRMPVIEPPALSVTVPNRAYADAIEACFNSFQIRTFVAQCEEDYQLLNRLAVDTTEAIGRRARISTWFRGDADRGTPPMTEDEMRQLGFDGYAIDFIDCPEGLKTFLQAECRLHRTAIGLSFQRVNGNKAMEIVGNSGGGTFIVGRTQNQVTRSAYGRRLAQNLTREILPARAFVGSTVDHARRQQIQETIMEARSRLETHDMEAAVLADEDRLLKQEHAEHKKQHDALNKRMKAVHDHHKRVVNMKNRLASQSDKLEKLKNAPPIDVEREKLKKSLSDVTKKRINLARQVTDLIRSSIADQDAATKAGLRYLQAGSNKTALDVLISERAYELDEAIARFDVAQRAYVALKEDTKRKLDASKAKLDEVDDDVRDAFREMERSGTVQNRDVEELQNELEVQRQKLDLCFQTNPGVIEQYERRKAEIEALTEKVAERQRKADKVERQIKMAKDNWHPALLDLVKSIGQKFSAAFERIGCAGEIELTEHEDYDKWAITIRVKFRDNEQLQQLTAHRQSGGERSLTTILYLMSLTEQARAPFSLVDEINQGMDQRAERTVHNELVKTTCGTGESGQYFLITPKLLPDLEYHRRMKVLCVNNGEWLTEDKRVGDLKTFLRRYTASAQAA
ncbi:P-loop containing nucleoside triphosphate hydrolase protein [Vararia minispora EC-137]|uniref:P-loop containing nucleoside triphosphate hydrolase protein n=1 Tax=Vararia minispora EC-137 TaxID=1314806 RepID=A0ACB8QEE9_9AGAM|nr:P-loop containing nucleoside triphosphate hydrolase protein [Vararia minispora EC-137]